jgi:hypothetical protein
MATPASAAGGRARIPTFVPSAYSLGSVLNYVLLHQTVIGQEALAQMELAGAADEAGEQKTILFNLSGHGHSDMAAYDNYFAGKLEDVALDEDEMERALRAEGLPTPSSRRRPA